MTPSSPGLKTKKAPEREERHRSKRWWVVGLLFFGVLINYVDRGTLSIAAIPIMGELHLSTSVIGVALSAFFWTYLVFQIPAGYFVDSAGLKWSYALSFLTWTIASAGIGLVHSTGALILMRMLLGMSEAVVAPASLAYVKRNFTGEEQGLPTAVFLSGMMLGPALGAFTGGVLLETLGWRSLCLVTGFAGLLWLWPWLHWAPKAAKEAAPQASGSRRSATKPILAFERVLSNPVTWGIGLSAFFYGYFWYFCLTWLPSYLILSRGFSYTRMGTFVAIPLAAMAGSCILFGRLADWLARSHTPLLVRKRFVVVGFLAGSSILMVTKAHSPAQVLAILICSFVAIGVAGANYWVITELVSPARLVGSFVGYQNAIAQIGGVAAPIITGVLLGNGRDFRLSFGLAGLCLPISAGAIQLLVRERSVSELHRSLGVPTD